VRWDGGDGPLARRAEDLVEVALVTTSDGPFTDDVFVMLSYADGSSDMVPLNGDHALLSRLQQLPGFDNETFIEAMSCTQEGVSVLWRG
jgi:hypothetical protein